jgi:antitoxin HigA-1
MSYNVIGHDGQEIKTDVLLHPGEVLELELEARGLKKSRFAIDLKMYPSQLNEILKTRRNVTEEIALKLENVLGISAETWMRLQVEYNIAVLRAKMKPAA